MLNSILVLSNCQTEGQKNSFSLLMPDTHVVGCDLWEFDRDIHDWKDRLSSFDAIVTNREITAMHSGLFHALDNVICFPSLFFRAMHPDLCHVSAGGANVHGPLIDYHSAIVISAYKSGVRADDVPKTFRQENFAALGFYDLWNTEKHSFLDRGKQEGLDLRAPFLRWTREREPFMYSFNHPKINVIYDVARQIAISRNWPIRETPHRPHDILAHSAVFPVYPELATRLGLAGGSYSFKRPGVYETLTLRDFVDLSYAEYEKHDRDALDCSSPQFTHAMKLLAEVE